MDYAKEKDYKIMEWTLLGLWFELNEKDLKEIYDEYKKSNEENMKKFIYDHLNIG